jgi:hypothetical protein
MTMKFMRATLLAAGFVVSIGAASANSDGGPSTATGYVYPNYWGQALAQQHRSKIQALGTDPSNRSTEVSLYPPNPWA